MALNRESAEPAYRQLYRLLRDEILGGTLGARVLLPSTRMLASDLGVSRNTVIAALDQLISEGYVESRRGSGNYVASSFPAATLRGKPRATRAADTAPRAISAGARALLRSARPPSAHRSLPMAPGYPSTGPFPLDAWRRSSARAWQQWPQELLEAPDPTGFPALRCAIASTLEAARGVRCKPSQVLVLSSSREAVYLAARVLAEPGERAWIEEPGYLGARASLLAAGLELVPVHVDADGIDVARARASDHGAKLAYVTPSNQFPLGGTLSLKRRLELIEWAEATGAWILEDDYDGEFRYGGHPLRALQGLDVSQRVIYIGTFSKTLFLGVRVAYLIAPEDLVDAFIAARVDLNGSTAGHAQATLADFITSGNYGSHVRRMRRIYAGHREALMTALAERVGKGLELRAPPAGLHLTALFDGVVDDRAIVRGLRQQGLGPTALSQYFLGARRRHGLVIGFAALDRIDPAAAAAAICDAAADVGVTFTV